jgi:LmbE family N-acetylglucosaminyl deacetylase
VRGVLDHVRIALIVAPHPDDEAIGAWGLMTVLRRRGVRLWVVVVSDGGASHPGSTTWPPTRLVLERRRETRRAMRGLGIMPSRIRFLALPDGKLDPIAIGPAIGRALQRMPSPDLVVGPVRDDAHEDHRAVAEALSRRRRGHLAYRVWPSGVRRGGGLRVPLDARTRTAKRRAVRSYRTQAGWITDSPTGMTITHDHLAAFVRPFEYFEVLA